MRKTINLSQFKVKEAGASDTRSHRSRNAPKYISAPPLAANMGKNHTPTVTTKAHTATSPLRKLVFCKDKRHKGARNSIVDCRIPTASPKTTAAGTAMLFRPIYTCQHNRPNKPVKQASRM